MWCADRDHDDHDDHDDYRDGRFSYHDLNLNLILNHCYCDYYEYYDYYDCYYSSY